MTYIQKLEAGESFEAKLCATYGPETEKGFPVELCVSVALKRKEKGWCLSMMGDLSIKKCEKIGLFPVNTVGQCIDSAVRFLSGSGLVCPTLIKMVPIWREWHLNDCHAGTKRQEDCIKEYGRKGDYLENCKVLMLHGLFEDESHLVLGRPYEYGSGRIFFEIPHEILLELCGLCDSGLVIYRKGQ